MEKIKELFVILENRPKALGEMLNILAKENIKIDTMAVFVDSAKLIVKNIEKTQKILKANNYATEIRDVIRTKVENKTKELAYIIERIGHVGINITYAYVAAKPGETDMTLIMDVSDVDTALSLFKSN
jgi:hypothetical protein